MRDVEPDNRRPCAARRGEIGGEGTAGGCLCGREGDGKVTGSAGLLVHEDGGDGRRCGRGDGGGRGEVEGSSVKVDVVGTGSYAVAADEGTL